MAKLGETIITTSSFFSKTNDVGTTHSTPSWMSCPISTINTAIKNNVPVNAKIISLKLRVTADFDCSMGLANVYLQYGFGDTSSISKHLLTDTKFGSTSASEYPTDGVDITSYLSSNISPCELSTAHGSYLTFRFYSKNRFSKKYHINSVKLEITYTESCSFSIEIDPPESGTITGHRSSYFKNETLNITAVANNGYEFYSFYGKTKDNGEYRQVRSIGDPVFILTAVSFVDHYTVLRAHFRPTSCQIITAVSPAGSGTVTGGGTYDYHCTFNLTATPNSGYKFVKWSDGDKSNPRKITTTKISETYTAIFELDKINKIYVGTSQPKDIYIGTSKVKGIYVGTTKVYG